MQNHSFLDKVIANVDTALRTLAPPAQRVSTREFPDKNLSDAPLSLKEKRHVSGLMRVNHSGEVAAQALYQGQALTAKLEHIKEQMNQAALEETEHLAWCEKRLSELDARPSVLNPLWYAGSLTIGALAGLIGDKWSLGFVVETERQVASHLEAHLSQLPKSDTKSAAILTQMQNDEAHHAEEALIAGGKELPQGIRTLMSLVSKVMTQSSYYC